MAEPSVRSDGWDRAQVTLTWMAAALVPLWLLLTAVVLELGRETPSSADVVFILLPDGTLEEDSGGATAVQVLAAVGSAGLVLLAVTLVVGPVAWAMARPARLDGAKHPGLIDPSLIEGAEWVVTVERGGDAGADPPVGGREEVG